MTRVLVTGANGFIGRRVVATLLADGFDVRALCRSRRGEGIQSQFAFDVEVLNGDIRDHAACRSAMNNVASVIHLAADVHDAGSSAAAVQDTNVRGTDVLLRAAQFSGVGRFVFASSAGVYGRCSDTAWVETDRPRPETGYASSKRMGEELCAAAGGLESVSARLPAVIGPGMRGSYRRLLDQITRGRVSILGKGTASRSLIAVDDAASFLCRFATHPTALPLVLNVSPVDPCAVGDIIRAAAGQFGRRLPPAAPVVVARVAAALLDARSARVRSGLGVSPPWVDLVNNMTSSAILDSSLLYATLGVLPTIDPLDALRDAIRTDYSMTT